MFKLYFAFTLIAATVSALVVFIVLGLSVAFTPSNPITTTTTTTTNSQELVECYATVVDDKLYVNCNEAEDI